MPKKSAPPPAGLYEACLQQEYERHARRLAEIKAMKARLGLLDAFMPALQAAGVPPLLDLSTWGGKALYVRCCHMTDPARTQKMVDTLIAAGMREVERNTYPTFIRVVLKKGRLSLSLGVDLPRDAKPATAPAPEGQPS